MVSQKINPLKALPVIIVATLLVVVIIYAWVEPTAPPPGGNVSAPLNVSTIDQTKLGALSVTALYDTNDPTKTYFIDPSGSISAILYGNVGIGTKSPKAALDITSTINGFLLPRMTTAQRNAIASPVEAMLIYNITTQCYDGYNASTSRWVSFGCIGCQLLGALSASAASDITFTSFVANWTAASGATTYYLDVSTVSTFASFVSGYNNLNVGSVLTASVTGLAAETTYYYRVRAGDACGGTSANSNTVTVTTSCYANGTACTAGGGCCSGNCVDGVCCDTTCTGDCRACNFAGAEGTCTLATAGTDPGNDCVAGWTSCASTCVRSGGDGYCDGAGACNATSENISSGYVCTGSGTQTAVSSSNYCNLDNVCTAGACSVTKYYTSCNGAGSCRIATDHTDSASTTVDCASGTYCSAGSCVPGNCAICKDCSGGSCLNVGECENCAGCTGGCKWCYSGMCYTCSWLFRTSIAEVVTTGTGWRCSPSRQGDRGARQSYNPTCEAVLYEWTGAYPAGLLQAYDCSCSY